MLERTDSVFNDPSFVDPVKLKQFEEGSMDFNRHAFTFIVKSHLPLCDQLIESCQALNGKKVANTESNLKQWYVCSSKLFLVD